MVRWKLDCCSFCHMMHELKAPYLAQPANLTGLPSLGTTLGIVQSVLSEPNPQHIREPKWLIHQ